VPARPVKAALAAVAANASIDRATSAKSDTHCFDILLVVFDNLALMAANTPYPAVVRIFVGQVIDPSNV